MSFSRVLLRVVLLWVAFLWVVLFHVAFLRVVLIQVSFLWVVLLQVAFFQVVLLGWWVFILGSLFSGSVGGSSVGRLPDG